MLIPQFSIRLLLGVTAVAAGVFSIVAAGVRGQLWAVGVSVGFFAIVAALFVFALLFATVWAFSLLPIASRQGKPVPSTTNDVVEATVVDRLAESDSPVGSPFAAAEETWEVK